MAAPSDAKYSLIGNASGSDDMFALDWGGDGGACWDVCNWSCFSLYCCACFCFCGPCSSAKLCSYALKQQCAIVNHCLPAMFCGSCTNISLRHSLRVQKKIGDTKEIKGWIGDCLLLCFCGPCACCQILRSVPPEAWDWLKEVQANGVTVMTDPCLFTLSE